MTGCIALEIYTKRLCYNIVLRRNITIIRGDSATGKTTLCDLLNDFNNNVSAVSVKASPQVKCKVLNYDDWQNRLASWENTVVFIDEDSNFVQTREFSKAVKGSSNYFVIINRHDKNLSQLPYSVTEIYKFKTSGKYINQNQYITLNETVPLWDLQQRGTVKIAGVITEDSNTGFTFYNKICGSDCKSANGKPNVVHLINSLDFVQPILVVVDGAAFGCEFEKLLLQKNILGKNVVFYMPESFEWFLLHSICFAHYKRLQSKLKEPEKYINSAIYTSWENYFEYLLHSYCNKLGFVYNKTMPLNYRLLDIKNVQLLLSNIKGVDFSRWLKRN